MACAVLPAGVATAAPSRAATDQAADEAAVDEHDGTEGSEPVVDADRPTRAAAHPDCGNRVPLWDHVVTEGEHLGGIAGRYGVRQRDLLTLNPGITDANHIRIGQSIRVCPEIFPRVRERKVHRVVAGQTLSKIALDYGMTVQEVVAMQDGKLSDPNRLRAGDDLVLWVDGGLVEAFSPPPPEPAAKRGGRRRGHARGEAVSVQLRADDRMFIKRPHLAFGTAKTIRLIDRAVAQYRGRFGRAPKVVIGDISRQGGGKIEPHASHRNGSDIDVGYVLSGADAKRTHFSGVTTENLDVARTWALLQGFLDTHEVRYIFMDYTLQKVVYEYAERNGASKDVLDEIFQYPRGRGTNHGIIRHWRSHRSHFHVRFRA